MISLIRGDTVPQLLKCKRIQSKWYFKGEKLKDIVVVFRNNDSRW